MGEFTYGRAVTPPLIIFLWHICSPPRKLALSLWRVEVPLNCQWSGRIKYPLRTVWVDRKLKLWLSQHVAASICTATKTFFDTLLSKSNLKFSSKCINRFNMILPVHALGRDVPPVRDEPHEEQRRTDSVDEAGRAEHTHGWTGKIAAEETKVGCIFLFAVYMAFSGVDLSFSRAICFFNKLLTSPSGLCCLVVPKAFFRVGGSEKQKKKLWLMAVILGSFSVVPLYICDAGQTTKWF